MVTSRRAHWAIGRSIVIPREGVESEESAKFMFAEVKERDPERGSLKSFPAVRPFGVPDVAVIPREGVESPPLPLASVQIHF